jgi:hypothetical protein
MILYIKGADFSAANIGTLNAYSVRTNIGTGASYDIPNSIIKGATGLVWEVSLENEYEFYSYSVTMGGVDITESTVSVSGNVLTITMPAITGNIVVSVATKNVNAQPDTPPSTGTTDTTIENISLADISQSLKLWTGRGVGSNATIADTITTPSVTIQENEFVKFEPSDKTSYALYSELPLYAGSEVSCTLFKLAVAGTENFCIGFESDIEGDWKLKNWKSDYTSICVPESHMWATFPNENSTQQFFQSLQRVSSSKFFKIGEGMELNALVDTFNDTNAYSFTLKVLDDGFEVYNINGNKLYTIDSSTKGVNLSHTTTPVYFCFTTATRVGIAINSIKQVLPEE